MLYNVENGTLVSVSGEGTVAVIPENVKAIAEGVFRSRRLERVEFPEGLTDIGDSAFENVSGLTAVRVPEGVRRIGRAAFADCEDLQSIALPATLECVSDSLCFADTALTDVSIAPGPKSIGDEAFMLCASLKEITIPEGVTHIGDSAFEDCRELVTVRLPRKMKRIGEQAFAGGVRIENLDLPKHLEEIGRLAFACCGHLVPGSTNHKLFVPETVGYIPENIAVGSLWSFMIPVPLFKSIQAQMNAMEENERDWQRAAQYCGMDIVISRRGEIWLFDENSDRHIACIDKVREPEG